MASAHCIHSTIFSLPIQERCSFVQDNCPYEYFNFYQMHFCLFNGNYLLTIPTNIILMIIFFFILSETSEQNLSSALTQLVTKLEISQNIAAVTLLALGNGAADVISSLVASTQNEGVEFAIGSLLGSCAFVTSCAFGIIIYSSGEIKSSSQALNRDIGLFICSLLFFLYIYISGSISIYQSITFFGIYILNIVIAFYQDWTNKKKKKGVKKDKEFPSFEINHKNENKAPLPYSKSSLPPQMKKSDIDLELDNCYKTPVNYLIDSSPNLNDNGLYYLEGSGNANTGINDTISVQEEDNSKLKSKQNHIDNTPKDTLINIPKLVPKKSLEEGLMNPFEFVFDKFKKHYLKHKEK